MRVHSQDRRPDVTDRLIGDDPPSQEQRRVIEAPVDRAQLIIAGAGTGKTKTMVLRFAWLVEHEGYDPTRIVAATFSKEAAKELRERIAQELMRRRLLRSLVDLDMAWIGTFHSLAYRLLTESPYETGFDRDIKLLDSLEQAMVVEDVKRSLRDGEITDAAALELEAVAPDQALRLSDDIFPLIQRVRGLGIDADQLKQLCESKVGFLKELKQEASAEDLAADSAAEREASTLFCATFCEYSQRLKQNKQTDFDGILMTARDSLNANPAFALRCRDRFQYVIVDEFQDTNHVQIQLLALLVRENCSNLAVVGDPRQSIYGWRDADVRNIIDFPKSVLRANHHAGLDNGTPDVDRLVLVDNYRSDQTILDGAYAFISSETGYENQALLSTPFRSSSEALELYRADTPEEEARFICSRIQELERRGTALHEMAILTRPKRPPLALEQELRRRNIPYLSSGGAGFFEREETKDALAYLRVINDPLDDQALIRILQGPLTRVSDAEVYALRRITVGALEAAPEKGNRAARTWDMLIEGERLGFPQLEHGTIERVRQMMDLIRTGMMRKAEASLSEMFQLILDGSGYGILTSARPPEESRRSANLRQLVRMASEFESRQVFSGVSDFVRYVEKHAELEVDVAEASIADVNAVRLMTIHKAKGLEFPVVFLAHVRSFRSAERERVAFHPDWGFILKHRTDENGDQKATHKYLDWVKHATTANRLAAAEINRIMYVGMTRAMNRLVVTATRPKQPSWDAVLAKPERGVQEEFDLFRRLACFVAGESTCGRLLPPSDSLEVGRLRDVSRPPTNIPEEPQLPVRTAMARATELRPSPVSGETALTVLSISALEIFEQCPLRYRYAVEWRIPAPPDGISPRRTTWRCCGGGQCFWHFGPQDASIDP